MEKKDVEIEGTDVFHRNQCHPDHVTYHGLCLKEAGQSVQPNIN